ncbi:MAG: hypothetical protein GXO71_02555 [Caldiserica bacterium]|nr:hypothetical protein [Caldisericota bacterium]
MGTRLIDKGLKAGELPEFWNIAYPESIKEIHQSYIKAGSKIIYTNTFGANRLKLKRAQKVSFLERFNTAAVKLAKEAAGDKVFVAGDIGPTGEFLKPYGGWEDKEFYQAFREQIEILVSEKVDLIVLETFSDLREIQIALQAAKETGNIPVFASMSFEKGKGGYKTIMGVNLEEMVQGLKEADAIGINCGGIYPGEAGEVIKEMKNFTDKPILVKLNAGKSKIVEGKVEYELGPEQFARDMVISIQAGAKFIGGCCGTTEKHIALLNELIQATAA